MSGSKFAVTPKLPAQLTGTWPIVVTKSGLAYNISFGTTSSAVSKRQFFGAVSALHSMTTLFAAVSANPEAAVWWQFYGGSYVEDVNTDPLYTLTKSTFSLSSAQMDAIFALAATLPY